MASRTGQQARALQAAFVPPERIVVQFIGDLANKWAGRHGKLCAALILADIDLRHGLIERAHERIIKALAQVDADHEADKVKRAL